ncbi:MAG: hypothetical protein ACREJM_15825 [Candidatus Saccharimonadales bacterium]
MIVRLKEALQEIEGDRRIYATEVIGRLLGGFPLAHPVRAYAEGCPRILEVMAAQSPHASEDKAMSFVLRAATDEHHSEPYGEKTSSVPDQRRVEVSDIADRIRLAVRPPREDATAARGALIGNRIAMTATRQGRMISRGRMLRARPAGCY